MPSRLGLPEVPCAKCGNRDEGIPWGGLCPACLLERRRRASRLSLRAGLVGTLVLAAYLGLRLPTTPTARIWGAVALLFAFVLIRQIVYRGAMEMMKL